MPFTPTATRQWLPFRGSFTNFGCPVSHFSVAVANLRFLLWSFHALRSTRARHLAATVLRANDTSHGYRGPITVPFQTSSAKRTYSCSPNQLSSSPATQSPHLCPAAKKSSKKACHTCKHVSFIIHLFINWHTNPYRQLPPPPPFLAGCRLVQW